MTFHMVDSFATHYFDVITKKAHQCLYFVKTLRRFSTSTNTLLNDYRFPHKEHTDWLHYSLIQQLKWPATNEITGSGRNCQVHLPTTKGIGGAPSKKQPISLKGHTTLVTPSLYTCHWKGAGA